VTNTVKWYLGVPWTNGTQPEFVTSVGGVRTIAALGGSFGREGAERHMLASFVKRVLAKNMRRKYGGLGTGRPYLRSETHEPRKQPKVGGSLINFSIYLTGEYLPGRAYSIKHLLIHSAVDTSGSNAYTTVVCGYPTDVDPLDMTTWKDTSVKYSIERLRVKGDLLEGTYVLDALPKKEKIKGVNKATFLINP
jgi:hypothetical protein